MGEWINVEDRLPEIGQKVWVKKEWHPLEKKKHPEPVRICKGRFRLYPSFDNVLRKNVNVNCFMLPGCAYIQCTWGSAGLTHWHADQDTQPEWEVASNQAEGGRGNGKRKYTWTPEGKAKRTAAVKAAFARRLMANG